MARCRRQTMQMGTERFLAMVLLTMEGRSEYMELNPTPSAADAGGSPSESVVMSSSMPDLSTAVSTYTHRQWNKHSYSN